MNWPDASYGSRLWAVVLAWICGVVLAYGLWRRGAKKREERRELKKHVNKDH